MMSDEHVFAVLKGDKVVPVCRGTCVTQRTPSLKKHILPLSKPATETATSSATVPLPQPESPSTTAPQPNDAREPVWRVTSLTEAMQNFTAAAAPELPRDSRVAFLAEANSLEKFSGHDELLFVKTWTKSVDDLATISGWNEYETYFAAKRALTGAAADWISTRGDLQSWKQLKEALKSTFQYDVNEYQIMEKLKKERPERNGSLVQYAHRMRRYASLASGISEKLTISYIVDGIPITNNAFDKLPLRACKSFDELRDALTTYEAACREEKERQKIISRKRFNRTLAMIVIHLLLILVYGFAIKYV